MQGHCLDRRIVRDLFGDVFDFNNDGKLDAFEKAAEFGAFIQMIDSEKNDEKEQTFTISQRQNKSTT